MVAVSSVDECEIQSADIDRHLGGFQSLLVAHVRPQLSRTFSNPLQLQETPRLSRGRCAAFWNFAWADCVAAYTNHSKTRLNTEDYVLWRAAGLQLTDSGSLYSSQLDLTSKLGDREWLTEEVVLRTVLWISLRTMNYIAYDSEKPLENETLGSSFLGASMLTPSTTASSPSAQHSQWDELHQQLDIWHQNLPETCQPCTKVKHHDLSDSPAASGKPLMVMFFSIPTCAAALVLYHFTRILLLLNKPVAAQRGSKGLGDRLKEYRKVSEHVNHHSREICGIAVGLPEPAVRIQIVQPLYLAGLCLEEKEDRKLVLELLQAIETDTGCCTTHRVRELVSQWGWDNG